MDCTFRSCIQYAVKQDYARFRSNYARYSIKFASVLPIFG